MINSFHSYFERKIHSKNNQRNDNGCNSNQYCTTLQFAPRRPTNFMKKLVCCFVNIHFEFAHFFNLKF